ncbi:MAG TPA: methyltransferase domain-containing protein [Gaiellaceae bacterium]|nr:methyltransferase domain-containing protein [Gaiellaceae bacterium]
MTWPVLACPSCRCALAADLSCPGCARAYQAPGGIPDLRLSYPDPLLSREQDARIAALLRARASRLGFAGLVDEHWRLVGKHPALAARFTAGELGGGRALAAAAAVSRALGRAPGAGDRILEIGCGSAATALACVEGGASAVATDVSLRWLALARTRLREHGAEGAVSLVACAAERLPFPEETFDVVVASDVIEHVQDAGAVVAEAARVLRRGGLLFLATPNRFSLGLEPHVRLPGVGWLPRPLARRYVELVRRTPYDHVRLLSSFELRRLLQVSGLEPRVELPAVPRPEAGYRGFELRFVRAYDRMRELPGARSLLLAVGPFFHVFGRKPPLETE